MKSIHPLALVFVWFIASGAALAQPAADPAAAKGAAAEARLKANLEQALQNPAADGANVIQARSQLIGYYQRNFRNEEAIPYTQQQLATVKERRPDSALEAAVQLNLAKQLRTVGRNEEALDPALAAQRIYQRELGDAEARSIDATLMVGWIYANLGRLNEAIPALEKAVKQSESLFGPQDPRTAWAKARLAGGYRGLGRPAEAEQLLLEAAKVLASVGEKNLNYGPVLGDLSSFYQSVGKLNEAEQYAQQAVTIYLNQYGPQWPATILRMRTLAEILLDQRRYQEAQKIAERALEYARQYHPGTAVAANTMSDLARVLQRVGQKERADALLHEAAAIFAKNPSQGGTAFATTQHRLGNAMLTQGRLDEARTLLESARDIYEKQTRPGSSGRTFVTYNLGRLELAAKNYPAAIALLATSAKMFTELKGTDHPDTAGAYTSLGTAYQEQGNLAAAIENYRTALKGLENYLAERQAQSPQARREQEANLRAVLRRYLNVAVQHRDKQLPDGRDAIEEAFVVGEQLRNRATQAAILGMSARAAVGDEELAQLVRREQDLRVQRGVVEEEISEGLSAARTAKGQGSQELIKKRNAIDGELAQVKTRILQRFPKYAQLIHPAPPNLAELRKLLPEDAAMLSYLVQDNRTLLWVITRDAVKLHVIKSGAAELEKSVQKLRRALDTSVVTLDDIPPYDTALAHELYQLLIAPAAADISGRRNLVVVPHGSLFSLPFAALVTSPTATPAGKNHFAEYRNVPWLGANHTTTVSPSALAFATLRKTVREKAAPQPFVGFGDPQFQLAAAPAGKTMQRSVRGSSDVQKLSPLPDTSDEVRQIAKALGASENEIYLGSRATEANVKRTPLDRYRVVAFATHGLISGDLDGLEEPALALTPPAKPSAEDDGLLTMSEVLGLKLNADWVVLSACNTASSDGSLHGDGLSGLTQAFFYAGSRALLVTLWPVESRSAQVLTTSLFAAVRDSPKLLRTQALATAQRAMIQAAGAANAAASDAHAYAHPFFWAPFILVGEGGAN